MIEMLLNPYGPLTTGRTLPGTSPVPGPRQVAFIAEACDPVNSVAYAVDGAQLADFVLPRYDDLAAASRPYDHTGRLEHSLDIVHGGQVEWFVGQPPVRWHRWYNCAGHASRRARARVAAVDGAAAFPPRPVASMNAAIARDQSSLTRQSLSTSIRCDENA